MTPADLLEYRSAAADIVRQCRHTRATGDWERRAVLDVAIAAAQLDGALGDLGRLLRDGGPG